MKWDIRSTKNSPSPKLDRESLLKYARELGLDLNKFTASIDGKKHAQAIERDKDLASTLAVFSTPTFFINGRKVVGDRPIYYFRMIIDEELKNGE